jgi:hypothetical protein
LLCDFAICARKALQSMKVPSGLVLKNRPRVGVKPGDVGFIYGTDVVAIELLQSRAVLFVVGHGLNSMYMYQRPEPNTSAVGV